MTTTLDPTLSVRGRIIEALKSDAALTAAVPSSRIYPGKQPAQVTFPFIRIPMLTGVPYQHDGGGGFGQSGLIHCFTKGSASNPDPEAQAAVINRHIARIVSSIDSLPLDDGEDLGVHVRQTQVIGDPSEADSYHGIVEIEALAS